MSTNFFRETWQTNNPVICVKKLSNIQIFEKAKKKLRKTWNMNKIDLMHLLSRKCNSLESTALIILYYVRTENLAASVIISFALLFFGI